MAKVVHIRQLIFAFSKHVYTIFFPKTTLSSSAKKYVIVKEATYVQEGYRF